MTDYLTTPFRARLYCKYCYSVHSDWHRLAREDYGGENTIISCGKCDHTSKVMLIDNVNDSKRALRQVRDEPPCDCGPFGMIGFNKKTRRVEPLGPE